VGNHLTTEFTESTEIWESGSGEETPDTFRFLAGRKSAREARAIFFPFSILLRELRALRGEIQSIR
jgi:hypothetical protein